MQTISVAAIAFIALDGLAAELHVNRGPVASGQPQTPSPSSYFGADENADWITVALAARSMGDIPRALDAVEKAIKLSQDNSAAYQLKGELLKEMGNLEGAEASFRALLLLRPADPAALEELGRVLYERGDEKGAKQALEQAERIGHGLSLSAYHVLAKIHAKAGACDTALAYLAKSTGLRGRNQASAEKALLMRNCLGQDSLYLHGDLNLLIDDRGGGDRAKGRREWRH